MVSPSRFHSADAVDHFLLLFNCQDSMDFTAESEYDHGTGLGLAIAERAVRMNGSQLEALNNVDGGLTMRIYLPLGSLAV